MHARCKPLRSHSLCRLAVAVPMATLACCAQAFPAAAADLSALWAQVEAEVGVPACKDAGVCRSIAIGHKACGGPTSYLAWSTAVSNEARLRERVAAHATAQQQAQRDGGAISNCMMLVDPGATCQAGRCMLKNEADAAARR